MAVFMPKTNLPALAGESLNLVDEKEIVVFGNLKGTVYINGDLLAPIDEAWDANKQKINTMKSIKTM